MRLYSVLHPIWMSFYSKKLYRDIGQHWKGLGFLYLLMLLAIAWLPTTINYYVGAERFLKDTLPIMLEQMPPITIKNGQLSVDAPMPIILKDDKNHHQVLVVIDTTGEYKSLEQARSNILITKTRAFVRDQETMQVYTIVYDEYNELRNLHLTPQIIMDYVDENKTGALVTIFIVLYFIMLLFSFVYRIIQALVFALITYLFVSNKNTKKDFDFVLRITCIALTPAIIVATVLNLFDINISILIYLLISIVYIFLGIHANKNIETHE